MKETEAFAAAHGLKWVQVEIYHAEVTALVSSDDARAPRPRSPSCARC